MKKIAIVFFFIPITMMGNDLQNFIGALHKASVAVITDNGGMDELIHYAAQHPTQNLASIIIDSIEEFPGGSAEEYVRHITLSSLNTKNMQQNRELLLGFLRRKVSVEKILSCFAIYRKTS